MAYERPSQSRGYNYAYNNSYTRGSNRSNVNENNSIDDVVCRKAIVVANKFKATRTVFLNKTGKLHPQDYDAISQDDTLNAIVVITRLLEQIKEKGEENGITEIYTLTTITQKMDNDLWKYWLKSGKTASGREFTEEELTAWTAFYALYKDLFMQIVFKPVSSLTRFDERNDKFVPGTTNGIHGTLCISACSAWDRIKVSPEEVEELAGEVI